MPDSPMLPPHLAAALADVPESDHAPLARIWTLATPPDAPVPDAARRDAVWARIEAARHDSVRPKASDLDGARAAGAPQPPRPSRISAQYERAPVARPAPRARWTRQAMLALPGLVVLAATAFWWQRPVVVAGQAGQVQVLADGSTVVLATGAEVRYARGAPRAVTLSGEATFEVVHDAGRPFTVTTPNARVEVLGTLFTVSAASNADTRVSVTRGRVAVAARDADTGDVVAAAAGNAPSRVVLGAGQQTRVAGTTAADVRVEAPSMGQPLAAGPIHVDGMPLGQLVDTLGQRYGVTIRLPDTLRSRPWTLHLDGLPVLDDALNAVTLPNGLTWRRDAAGTVVVSER